MDTNETGARLDLTEGLHIGGTGQALWFPPYGGEAMTMAQIAQFFPFADRFSAVVLSDTMTQAQLDVTQHILLFGPQEAGDYILYVDGIIPPGKTILIGFEGSPTAELTYTARVRFLSQGVADAAPAPGPGPVFHDEGQWAAMQGGQLSPPTSFAAPNAFPVGLGASIEGGDIPYIKY
jgi:hypothetical protein